MTICSLRSTVVRKEGKREYWRRCYRASRAQKALVLHSLISSTSWSRTLRCKPSQVQAHWQLSPTLVPLFSFIDRFYPHINPSYFKVITGNKSQFLIAFGPRFIRLIFLSLFFSIVRILYRTLSGPVDSHTALVILKRLRPINFTEHFPRYIIKFIVLKLETRLNILL